MHPSHYLTVLTFLACLALPHPPVQAQSRVSVGGASFSYGSEIRYPTSFEVSENNVERNPQAVQPGIPVVSPPIVIPGDFETRTVGQKGKTGPITVSGFVSVQRAEDGSRIISLHAKNGSRFRVKPGGYFRLGGRVFQAIGFFDKVYRVQDVRTKKTYVFVPPASS